MAFRMSEQPRTIKFITCWPELMNLLVKVMHIFRLIQDYLPNSTDIAPPDIPAGFVAVFNSDEASWHLVEDHRGKTVYDVTSGDALFISELGPLPENVALSRKEVGKLERTAWVKDVEAEKLFPDPGGGRNKKQPDAGGQ